MLSWFCKTGRGPVFTMGARDIQAVEADHKAFVASDILVASWTL